MFWLSRINEHSTYVGGLLGPMMVTAAGLGMLFMPLTLVALSKVQDRDAGLASSLLNTGQQVGGAIGLALLGTVAWTVVANSIHAQVNAAAAAAAKAGQPIHAAAGGHLPAAIYDHALSVGFSRGFLVSSAIALLGFLVTLVMIRVKRSDLAGAQETMALATAEAGRRARRGGVTATDGPAGRGTGGRPVPRPSPWPPGPRRGRRPARRYPSRKLASRRSVPGAGMGRSRRAHGTRAAARAASALRPVRNVDLPGLKLLN